METFKEKLAKTIRFCEIELDKRKAGIHGESTIEELEDEILPELRNVLKLVNGNKLPAKEERYLESFACAFTIWGWNMQEPTEIFTLLVQLNNEYKKL